jgi:hypothetical protein
MRPTDESSAAPARVRRSRAGHVSPVRHLGIVIALAYVSAGLFACRPPEPPTAPDPNTLPDPQTSCRFHLESVPAKGFAGRPSCS